MFHMCQSHFRDLDAALKFRGLGKLIHDEPSRNRRFALQWIKGQVERHEDFDPRAVALLEIYKKAAELWPDIHRAKAIHCPLCTVNFEKVDHSAAGQWVSKFAELVTDVAKKLKLIS